MAPGRSASMSISRAVGVDGALVALVTTALAYACILVARQPGTLAAIWLANAVAIGMIVTAPRRRRLALQVAAAAGNLAANLAFGNSLGVALAFLLPNVAEIALGVRLVVGSGHQDRWASDHRSFIIVLGAGALVPPLAGATLGAAILHALDMAPFTAAWLDWYIGAALGGVSCLPLVLSLRGSPGLGKPGRLLEPRRVSELAVLALVFGAVLHWTPDAMLICSVLLMTTAFTRARLTMFAAAPLFVGVLAVSLALRWFAPAMPGQALGLYLAALLVIVPPQVVSVVVARQRALGEMLAAVGSRVDEIVAFVDTDGVCRWVNEAHVRYWGVPKARLLGRPFAAGLPRGVWEAVFRRLFEQACRGEDARAMADLDFAIGVRNVEVLLQPARDEDGQRIGVLICVTDLTEIERSRRELRAAADRLSVANRKLEQFVRIASHDLREPLNTIAQFCELIERGPARQLEAPGPMYFGHVRQGATRMKAILDDVLQYVRLDESFGQPRETVDLDAVSSEVRRVLEARIGERGAAVHVAPLGSVTGHRGLLALALQNLLSNALKFVPGDRSPQVEVRLERFVAPGTAAADGVALAAGAAAAAGQTAPGLTWVRLTVADNGIGIEASRIAELGTPFRRLHARRKFDGTGLGLAICSRIAEHHGGRLRIASEPGVGSRFSMEWPLST